MSWKAFFSRSWYGSTALTEDILSRISKLLVATPRPTLRVVAQFTGIIFCILSRVGVTYKTGFLIGFIAPYTLTQFGTTGNTALSLFYTLSVYSCTRTRVLSLHQPCPGNGFITLCLFKSYMRSSWHSLIHFLPLFSSQFSSSAPRLIPWQAGVSKLDSPLSTTATVLYYSVPSSDCVLL
jgi:hypothetical protein